MGDWWNALPFVGSAIDAAVQPGRDKKAREFQHKMWVRQRNYNTEILKNQLQWRMEDAGRAGIHPLAALGVNPASGPSMSVGDTGGGGPDFGSLGQDLSRAISAQSTHDERDDMIKDLQISSLQADIGGKHINNAIAATQLGKLQAVGPPFPGSTNFIPGQGDSPTVDIQPAKPTASQPGRPAQEARWSPDVGYSRTDTGLAPVIPQGLSESLEDDLIGKLMWRFRNQGMPNFFGNVTGEGAPPKNQLPKGATHWKWHHGRQEWQPAFGKNRAERAYDSYKRMFRRGGR